MTTNRSHPWERHPAIKGRELTTGERAADHVRNGMGSWPFVFAFLGSMAVWVIVNTMMGGKNGFDPFPYILLNLFLSMIAGLQGAILLIAAKRSDSISAEHAQHTFDNTEADTKLLTENTELTRQVKANTDTLSALADKIDALAVQVGTSLSGTVDHRVSPRADVGTTSS